MAKVLKFDLMLDNCNVRSLEGLQEHFVIEYVLKYFEDGTLSRWLKVLNYSEQLAEVEAIDKTLDKKDIALQLAHIFGIENVDSADVEKALSVFSYLEKKQELTATVQENALFKKQAVEEYLADYEALIQHMIDNSGGNIVERLNKVFDEYELGYTYRYRVCNEDVYGPSEHPYLHVNTDISINVGALKEDVQKLEQDYLQLVKLSFSELYFRLVEIAPMAIVAMLWSDTFRELLIGENANVYLKNSFYCNNISVDKKYPVLLRTIQQPGGGKSFWYYIFTKFYHRWAIPNIDGLKIKFLRMGKNQECKIIEAGNKVIVLSSDLDVKSVDTSSNFSQAFPRLCDGLVVKDGDAGNSSRYDWRRERNYGWPYRQFVIYMSA